MNDGVPRPATRLGGLLKVVLGLSILSGVAGSSFAQTKADPEKQRQEEQRRQEEARRQEQQRQEQQRQEQQRQEQQRQEQQRQEQQRQEQQRQEQARRADDQRKADEARRANEARKAEDARKADEDRRKQQESTPRTNPFEQARQLREAQAAEQRKADEARKVDETRKAEEERRKRQEAKRVDEERQRGERERQAPVNNFELGRQYREALKKEPAHSAPKPPDKPVVPTQPGTTNPSSGGKLPFPKVPDRPPVVIVPPPVSYPPTEKVYVGGESVAVCNPTVPIIVQIPIVIDAPSEPPPSFANDARPGRIAVPTNVLGMPKGFSEDYASVQFQTLAPKPKFNWKGAPENWLANAGAAGWKTTIDLRHAMPGALIVWRRGYNGHVAVVDKILPNGFIVVSEMNMGDKVSAKNGKTSGFGRVSRTVIDPSKPNRGIFKFGGLVLPIRLTR